MAEHGEQPRLGTIIEVNGWVPPVAPRLFFVYSYAGGQNVSEGAPAVIDEISIALEAKDPAANRLRSWHLEAGPDLFGIWVAQARFGRIGTMGRAVSYHFGSEAEARSFVRARLCRRQTAKRRIGVAYRAIAVSPLARPLLQLSGLAEP